MPGRPLKWFTTLVQDQALAAGAGTNHALLTTLEEANAKGSTVTRIILNISLATDTLVTDGFLPFGIVYVNADAVIASAFPDPGVASDNVDWLVRDQLHTRMSSLSDGSQLARARYDLRAQRVARSAQDQLHLVTFAAGVGLEYAFFCRVLMRLP